MKLNCLVPVTMSDMPKPAEGLAYCIEVKNRWSKNMLKT